MKCDMREMAWPAHIYLGKEGKMLSGEHQVLSPMVALTPMHGGASLASLSKISGLLSPYCLMYRTRS